jgi:hypothetical protein
MSNNNFWLGRHHKAESNVNNMIRRCAWCKKIMGEKAPFDNKGITDGMCDNCYEIQNKKLEALDEKNKMPEVRND